MAEKQKTGIKIIIKNKKAFHEFFVLERYEAGIVLKGTEVKSLRIGKINFLDAYASIVNKEVWLKQMHISPYSHGNRDNHDPARKRKLLFHSKEILKIDQKMKEKGLTLIPLSLYFLRGKVKVEIGLCKGKKLHDKRKTLQEKDAKREMDRETRNR
ncbi:MAG: SsrA-binding protein SmpB [Spirochaetes bacterium]|nr:SsrA-binding protein SmpB [Spirochaetota bacterium]